MSMGIGSSGFRPRFDSLPPPLPVQVPVQTDSDGVDTDRAEELSFELAPELHRRHRQSRGKAEDRDLHRYEIQRSLAFWREGGSEQGHQELNWLVTAVLRGEINFKALEDAVPEPAERYLLCMGALQALDGQKLSLPAERSKDELELYSEELYTQHHERIVAAEAAREVGTKMGLSRDEAAGLREAISSAASKPSAKALLQAFLAAGSLVEFKRLAAQLGQTASMELNRQLPLNMAEGVAGVDMRRAGLDLAGFAVHPGAGQLEWLGRFAAGGFCRVGGDVDCLDGSGAAWRGRCHHVGYPRVPGAMRSVPEQPRPCRPVGF